LGDNFDDFSVQNGGLMWTLMRQFEVENILDRLTIAFGGLTSVFTSRFFNFEV
jgi:hypothetical protein